MGPPHSSELDQQGLGLEVSRAMAASSGSVTGQRGCGRQATKKRGMCLPWPFNRQCALQLTVTLCMQASKAAQTIPLPTLPTFTDRRQALGGLRKPLTTSLAPTQDSIFIYSLLLIITLLLSSPLYFLYLYLLFCFSARGSQPPGVKVPRGQFTLE